MNPTTKPLAITLGGKRYHLHFNLNTFEKFEEITGKHFLEFVADMQEALETSSRVAVSMLGKNPSPADLQKAMEQGGKASLAFLKKLSIKDVRAFFYAALHEYDSNDEPVWTLTIGQMGKIITMDNIPDMVRMVMQGHVQNSPGKEDEEPNPMGEEEEPGRPTTAGSSIPANGGMASGPSDEEILDSLTKTSEG